MNRKNENAEDNSLQNVFSEALNGFKKSFFKDQYPSEDEIDLHLPYARSTYTLGMYSTLDWQHISSINIVRKKIEEYSMDKSLRRPLNFMMVSEPGLGKSFFVKCLAERMKNKGIEAVTYNMASLQNNDDLIHPLDSIRNLKVRDVIPILFLDEFDSHPEKTSILLPLLWDGEYHFSNRDIKLGKVVIILGGSNDELIKMQSQGNEKSACPPKIWDLFSRINGGFFEIPSLEKIEDERDRRIDKICISISLLQQRFGKDLQLVPWSILNFIGQVKFKFGVRSIAHVVDTIPYPINYNSNISWLDVKMPLTTIPELKNSSLYYHLSLEQDLDAIITLWNKLRSVKTQIRIASLSENGMF